MLIKLLSKPHGSYNDTLSDYKFTYIQDNEDFVLSIYKPRTISSDSISTSLGSLPIIGIATTSTGQISDITTDSISPMPIIPIINPIVGGPKSTNNDIGIGIGQTVYNTINYSDVKELSENFGIVSYAIDHNTKKFSLFSLTQETYITKENFTDYHNRKNLISLIVFFTPYKGCEFSDCNIVIRSDAGLTPTIDFDGSTIAFEQNITSMRTYVESDNCWGPESNYPSIAGPNTSKVGIQTSFFVNVPNNVTLYLETNIGILNKTKITKSTDVVLNLSSVTNSEEDAIIKISSKYWTGLYKHTINLIE